MSTISRIAFINPNSRRGSEWVDALAPSFEANGIELVVTESSRDMERRVAEAIRQGYDQVWVGGGDGTIGNVIGQFVNASCTLGILPLGTGNALANELGIPSNPNTICAYLIAAEPTQIDVGKINDRYFCTIATLGITTGIASELQGTNKGRFGRLHYVPAVLRSLRSRKPAKCRITSNGAAVYRGRITQLVVANTATHAGPFTVTNDASLTDGMLSAYWLKESTRLALLKYGVWMVRRESPEVPEIGTLSTPSIEISSTREMEMVVDGDLLVAKRFNIRSVAKAVSVLAAPVVG